MAAPHYHLITWEKNYRTGQWDPQKRAGQIIHLIFNRWTQENDFKCLDQHFGINPITSYASVAYERLKDPVEEKQIKRGAHKALEQQTAPLKSQLHKLLLSQPQYPRKSARRTERIATLTKDLAEGQKRGWGAAGPPAGLRGTQIRRKIFRRYIQKSRSHIINSTRAP